MPNIDISLKDLIDAADNCGEFKFVDSEPPTSLGEDQYPAFVIGPTINFARMRPVDPRALRYDGEYEYVVSMLFDRHVIDTANQYPNSEMVRVRKAWHTQLETDEGSETPFVLSDLRHYISRFSNREIRVVAFTASRYNKEDNV